MEGSCIDLVLTAGVRTEEISLLEEKKKNKKTLKSPKKPKENCTAISRAAEIYQCHQTPETKKGDQVQRIS